MGKQLIFVIAIFAVLFTSCESREYDSRAIESLDKLSETIGELKACSYTLNTIVLNDSIERNTLNDVYMRGTDKLYINTVSEDFHFGFWYNGKTFSYLVYDKNKYDIIEAPETTLETIDLMHHKHHIDFPASDFFYPGLTDDIIENYEKVVFSEEEIDEIVCTLIEASNEEETVLIWIDKATNLPYRLVIESNKNDSDLYDAVFSNWVVNPALPDVLFEFQPTENLTKIQLENKTI
ncbi:MAG: hypothetical protein COB60_12235 [Flavobacteriaceae bacterium]|nr:MAG: hypothetical protein COB60_12235 [Flavobacteriaceae bacterium]